MGRSLIKVPSIETCWGLGTYICIYIYIEREVPGPYGIESLHLGMWQDKSIHTFKGDPQIFLRFLCKTRVAVCCMTSSHLAAKTAVTRRGAGGSGVQGRQCGGCPL